VDVELFGERVQRVVLVVVGVAVTDRAGDGDRHEAELGDRAPGLVERIGQRLQRQRGRALEPVGSDGAVRGEPVVVRAAARDREVDVGHRVEAEARGTVEDRDVDALGVHVDKAGLRVSGTVALRGRLLDALGDPGPDARAGWHDAAVEHVAGGPALVVDEAGPPVNESRIEVLLPEPVGFEDVTVEVDDRQPGRSAHRDGKIAP